MNELPTMTPDQMTELAARLRELALSIGNADYAADLDRAADLIESMAQRVPLSDEENERLRADAERMKKEIEQCRQNQ